MKKMLSPVLLFCGTAIAQTTDPTPYCMAQYSDDIMNIPHVVERVIFGTLDYTSGETQYAAPHYVFYNNLPAPNAAKGQVITLTVQHDDGFTIHALGAWIDFNGDHDFDDAGEKVGQTSWPGDEDPGTGNSVTYQVMIPQSAAVGNTRMRVRVYEDDNYTGSGPDMPALPCQFNGEDADWGETEDYTVNITAAAGLDESAVSAARISVSNNQLLVSGVTVKEATIIELSGKAIQQFNGQQADVSALPAGIYVLQIETMEGAFAKQKIVL